jgi:hypothetical protein
VPTEVRHIKKLIQWFVCVFACCFAAATDSNCLAQPAPVHVNSIRGNGFSHSFSKLVNRDGTYTICESYRNGATGKRWSKMYSSWDNKWTFYGDQPSASQGRKSPRSPQLPPKKISLAESQKIWIKNPFFKQR